jgi:hypothetical protein
MTDRLNVILHHQIRRHKNSSSTSAGFSVHSRVRARTRDEAGGIGRYMIRPLLSLERLSLDEKEGKVCYHYGNGAGELERMDDLEFIARVTSHIPDKRQVMVHYYKGNKGKKKASRRAMAFFSIL